MKKIFVIMLVLVMIPLCVVGCSKKFDPDYPNAEEFELALNSGEDVVGKTVTITATDVHVSPIAGYNVWAGEHLNFMFDKHPGFNSGDAVTLKIVECSSLLGSFILKAEVVK